MSTATLAADLLGGLFDAQVKTACSTPDVGVEVLLPEELSIVASAIDKRRREFATGRLLARKLLAEFGVPERPLLRDADRVPIWPEGMLGSISHTQGLCVVAVAKQQGLVGLGLDVEPDVALEEKLWSRICSDGERRWLEGQPASERGPLGKLIFSAKEAFYKSVFPSLRVFLDFSDVEVSLDLAAGCFNVQAAEQGRLQQLPPLQGRFARRRGFVLSAATVLSS